MIGTSLDQRGEETSLRAKFKTVREF